MPRLINRTLSLLVCIFYLYIVYGSDKDIGSVAKSLIALLLPMACIWFSEPISQYTGAFFPYSYRNITETSPAGAVLFLGWVILIIPLLIMLYSYMFFT